MSGTRLLDGTIPELLNPFRQFGQNVQRFYAPVEASLLPNPLLKTDTRTATNLFKNRRGAPGTKPTYGMLMPGRF